MATPQAPEAPVTTALLPRAPEPRKLSAGYGASWWAEGWRVFAASPGIWLLIVLIVLVLMFLLIMVPVIGSIAQTLLFPVFGGGVMLGCHALARGEPLQVNHLFEGFGSGRFGPLVIIGLVMLAASIVLALVVLAVIFASLGVAGLRALSDLADSGSVDVAALSSLGLGFFVVFAVGLIGVILIAMAYWFAPALIVLNGEEPISAMRKSFGACWHNFGAVFVYVLLYIALAILASIPLGFGWFILVPMIAGSCYAGWRTTFG
jgi:uncharacterized membrane protein